MVLIGDKLVDKHLLLCFEKYSQFRLACSHARMCFCPIPTPSFAIDTLFFVIINATSDFNCSGMNVYAFFPLLLV